MKRVVTTLAILWALPWTLFGLTVGALGLASGGRCQRSGRVIEFWGGFTTWFMKRFPVISGARAVTFGHSVLAQTAADVESTREHERVHVAQYERWGPAFVPVYLACSAVIWLRGRGDPYYDNPFEREAYDTAG